MPVTPVQDSPRQTAKTVRLEARIIAAQKSLILEAAALTGRSLSDFIVSSAYQAAARAIREHEVMTLGTRDRRKFVAALLNPPAPTARLRKAARRHKRITGLADAR